MKKRVVSLLLSVALGLSLATAAPAEEAVRVALPRTPAPLSEMEEAVLIEASREGEGPAQPLADVQPDYVGAAKALYDGIAKREEVIYYLGKYHIPNTTEAVGNLARYMKYRYGELFAFTGRYGRNQDGEYLTAFGPEYNRSAAEYAADLAEYNKALDAIIAQIPEGFTDVEKVLFIHDYLTTHYEYDYDFKNYDAYSFLRDGKGVCQAYMLVFSALMDRLKIPVSYVDSKILNHTWNVVKLDGKWYHVDATWDDPGIVHKDASGEERLVDVLGAAQHEFFLLSDATNDARRAERAAQQGIANYAKDFVCGEDYIHGAGTVACDDTTYETSVYAKADSPMVYVAGNDSWYYISTNSANTEVESERGGLYRWRKDEGSVRLGSYSRYVGGLVPLVEYQGSLFFSDPEKICRYELDEGAGTGKVETLFPNPDAANAPFSGIRVDEDEGKLYYKLRATGEQVACTQELMPWHAAADNAFSYYYNFGGVGIKVPELRESQMFIAWYDPDSGMMTRLEVADADGVYGVPVAADKDLTCAIFLLSTDGKLIPAQPKFTVHDVSGAPAQ